MNTCEYEIFTFADGAGQMYISDNRSAVYQWIRPGYTEIHLIEMVDGREVLYVGSVQQGEKADGLCLAWIEERFMHRGFQRATPGGDE